MSGRHVPNPTLIRPAPEFFEKVMRQLRGIFDRFVEDAWRMDFTVTKPATKDVRSRDGFVHRIYIDSRMGDKITIEPHGSWFEVFVGPKFTPSAILQIVGRWARERYGRSRGAKIEEEVRSMVEVIVESSRMSAIAGHPLAETIEFYDFSGTFAKAKCYIYPEKKYSIGGFVNEKKDKSHRNIVVCPPEDMTIRSFRDSWPTVKRVMAHELTHAIDPGAGRVRYAGGPDETIKKHGFGSIQEALDYESSSLADGYGYGARSSRMAIEKALVDYHGDPMEIRAEASSILWSVRKKILSDWMPDHHRPMPSSLLWDFIQVVAVEEGRSYWLRTMRERDQGKLLAYIAQALIEEGLIV